MSDPLDKDRGGRWQTGHGARTRLFDPVLGEERVRVDAAGMDPASGLAFTRQTGGNALRHLGDREGAVLPARAAEVLPANRGAYFPISTANNGTVRSDRALDIDSAIAMPAPCHDLDHGLARVRRGGEERGGLRALRFDRRRRAIQAAASVRGALQPDETTTPGDAP